MTSYIHVGSRNLLVELKEIKFCLCLAEFFLSGNLQKSIHAKLKILQIFGLTKLSTILQYKFQN